MDKEKGVINILESILGKGKKKSQGNWAFKCPNPKCNHVKNKLEININEGYKYHCWVCNYRGSGLVPLLNALKLTKNKKAEILEHCGILDDIKYKPFIQDLKPIGLPEEFIPFYTKTDSSLTNLKQSQFLNYLKYRGVTQDEILKYNIGFCVKGKYDNCIILPSYDENNNINFFTGKNVESNTYNNPVFTKDIIGFDYFINWDLPITIVEGPFDAITAKRNTIPLFGKQIQDNLMKKIMESKVDKIYICLDPDAIRNAIEYCELLMNYGKEIYLIELFEGDINSIGFDSFLENLEKVKPMTFEHMIKIKLNL